MLKSNPLFIGASQEVSQDIYLAYFTNRFRAARYGFDAELLILFMNSIFSLIKTSY